MLYQHFVGNLPNSRSEFLIQISKIFPRIVDVRYNLSRRGYTTSTKYENQIHSHNRTYEEPPSFNTAEIYVSLILDSVGIEENMMFSPFCNDIWNWITHT
jgi:hypothetical protein